MTVNLNIFDHRQLTEAINLANIFEPFLLTAVFSKKEFSEADKIDKMKYKHERGISAAVSKNAVSGNLIEKGSADHGTLEIPKFWDMKVFTANELKTMQVPAIYADSAQRKEQVAQAKLREVDDMKRRVLRTAEKMAADILLTGATTSGDYTETFFTVGDRLEDISGSSTRKWDGGSAIDILGDLDSKMRKVTSDSGEPVTKIIMGETAFTLAMKNSGFREALNTNNFRIGQLDMTIPPETGGSFRGRILGADVYVYAQKYATKAGKVWTAADIFDTNKVLFVASNSRGFVHQFAAIDRIDKNTGNLEIYPVDYLLVPIVNPNGTALTWEIESKNIPCVWDENALAILKVK